MDDFDTAVLQALTPLFILYFTIVIWGEEINKFLTEILT